MTVVGKVFESSATSIIVKMEFENFEKNKDNLKIGKHLKISVGNHDCLISTIKNIRAISDGSSENDKYLLTTDPVGIISDGVFTPGSSILPSPTEEVEVADKKVLEKIFLKNDKYSYKLGEVTQNKDISLFLDGNKFFGKHIGIVGSTGSGKSCTVAKIIQEAVGIKGKQNKHIGEQKNSHVIIFDIHSEYEAAFTLEEKQKFSLNLLEVGNLKLPYWLMNSEELESLFIESNELNSYNQVSQFRKAVILNKEKYNSGLDNVTYDTPVYFSIKEVYTFIKNVNNEMINKVADTPKLPKIISEVGENPYIDDINRYFEKEFEFVPSSNAGATKATSGPYHGDFNRFISRLENKINDKRLKFIIDPKNEDGSEIMTNDFEEILKQFLGYIDQSNISIIDLSGIPFEVLSIIVSLISRIIFDFAFHYSKLKNSIGEKNDVPFLIVCEEAHNYIPRDNSAYYKASKKSLERIAKEGRKYGLSLMVVSQRPSEVSDTIFSQCNNFISLRLTNISDQSYIKNLLPNNTNSIADILPTLASGECLVVGDAVPIATVAKMSLPDPKPHSEDIEVYDVWNENWKKLTGDEDEKERSISISIENVLERWRN